MLKYFRPVIKSRHPSHEYLRRRHKKFPLFNTKSVIRFGSTTDMVDTESNGGGRVEINTIEAIKNSSSKLRMKECFSAAEVKTAPWYRFANIEELTEGLTDDNFPIISKSIYGSRGQGNKKHDTKSDLLAWAEGKDFERYIFEEFKNFNREYRLHITEDGCFYTCRKMLKRDTPEEARWYRNDEHCVWILEDNEAFDKPVNWDDVVTESVKALKSVGLDIGAVDLRIQSATNKDGDRREYPEFIVVEINSAPSFGEVTKVKYLEELTKLIIRKDGESTRTRNTATAGSQ